MLVGASRLFPVDVWDSNPRSSVTGSDRVRVIGSRPPLPLPCMLSTLDGAAGSGGRRLPLVSTAAPFRALPAEIFRRGGGCCGALRMLGGAGGDTGERGLGSGPPADGLRPPAVVAVDEVAEGMERAGPRGLRGALALAGGGTVTVRGGAAPPCRRLSKALSRLLFGALHGYE